VIKNDQLENANDELNTSNSHHITLEEEMKQSYLDYAMSVIISRALPDVRDGLKPVHRRILYAMNESGNTHNKSYRKSANALGYVMMKYHPHGDNPIYEALVRMAQDFSLRMPLIDGQGNFGSMDGDPPAAFRYTEARLSKIATILLEDIDKETVSFRPNFDNTTKEPVVLPAQYPNILINGTGGIAVGMATNIPPHNLNEVIDACCAYIDNSHMSISDIMEYIKGPDFPTGGTIIGRLGIKKAYTNGKGAIVIRSKSKIEITDKDRKKIVIEEIPYQVNKSKLVERIAELTQLKIIEGIHDIRDESNHNGVRVVVELKKDTDPNVVLNILYKHSPLQINFNANILAISNCKPVLMDIKNIISEFVKFRQEIIIKKTNYELKKIKEKAHILIGFYIAIKNIDTIIKIIHKSSNSKEAYIQLTTIKWPLHNVQSLVKLTENNNIKFLKNIDNYSLTHIQTKAIMDIKLNRLTSLERNKIDSELKEIIAKAKYCFGILNSHKTLMNIIREELTEIKETYSMERKTEIQEGEFFTDLENLIKKEEMVITVSHNGYVKRVPLDSYKSQRRGGKGRSGMSISEEDFVKEIFVSNTHTPVLFFSTNGKVFQMKVYRLPLRSPQSRGKAFINLLPLDKSETISTVLTFPNEIDINETNIMFATSKGNVRKNKISDFVKIKSNGKIAMKLGPHETLVSVKLCSEEQDILLTTKQGKCIRFSVLDVRVFTGRNSTGVRGIKLSDDDEIISMSVLNKLNIKTEEKEEYLQNSTRVRKGERLSFNMITQNKFEEWQNQEEFIFSITSRGMGKCSSAFEYRQTKRGGKGISNMLLTKRTGYVVASFPIDINDELVLVTNKGKLIRTSIEQLRIVGRMTQGVTIFKVKEQEQVVSVSTICKETKIL
jgi:DNA gyrase subunit A